MKDECMATASATEILTRNIRIDAIASYATLSTVPRETGMGNQFHPANRFLSSDGHVFTDERPALQRRRNHEGTPFVTPEELSICGALLSSDRTSFAIGEVSPLDAGSLS